MCLVIIMHAWAHEIKQIIILFQSLLYGPFYAFILLNQPTLEGNARIIPMCTSIEHKSPRKMPCCICWCLIQRIQLVLASKHVIKKVICPFQANKLLNIMNPSCKMCSWWNVIIAFRKWSSMVNNLLWSMQKWTLREMGKAMKRSVNATV